jgi:hypothetical protein
MDRIPKTTELQNFNMKLYSPNNEFIGVIHNELQLLYVQAQIAKEQTDGYYAFCNKEVFTFTKDGIMDNFAKLKLQNSMMDMLEVIMGV